MCGDEAPDWAALKSLEDPELACKPTSLISDFRDCPRLGSINLDSNR